MPTIAVSVRLAVRTAGWRNNGTPLLTASTPVMAVVPLANDRISNQPVTATVAGIGAGVGATGTGWPWAMTVRATPTTITNPSEPTNRYVGNRNTSPDSLIPRRLTMVKKTRIARQSGSV